MKMMRTGCAAAFLAVVPAQGQSMLEACKADIASFCPNVEPGHGHIASCLYAHEDKISDACDAATGDLADILDLLFNRLTELQAACGADMMSHCSDVEIGGGRIYSCLRENAAKTSAECTAQLDKIELPRE